MGLETLKLLPQGNFFSPSSFNKRSNQKKRLENIRHSNISVKTGICNLNLESRLQHTHAQLISPVAEEGFCRYITGDVGRCEMRLDMRKEG